ncbi:hypothetical protein FRC09_000882 [Ceratobasidium sp. 395]|nr:hypothetical protein FRC09_000882 [Ceratobasidium sp. 395]
MPRPLSNLFQHINNNPNTQEHPSLLTHRKRQRRPISINPFEPAEPTSLNGVETTELPALSHRLSELSEDQPSEKQEDTSKVLAHEESRSKSHDEAWGQQPPEWLNLFYDLTWTASFASLTSNNKFRAPWDSVSYITFFVIMWWIWTSQVFYAIDFYTDDWLHLVFIFCQLIIFGLLATVTRGLDVSTYILHSPGSTTWESYDPDHITPDLYAARRLTKKSFEFIAIVIAASRALLLLQHVIVNVYAKRTSRTARFPRRLLIVPCSLAISTGLFFAGYVITLKHGEEAKEAKIKFILWGCGLLLEVVAHIVRFQLEIDNGLQLKSHGSIVNRFCGITTIIVGEGINAVAGTFYAIMKAPGFSKDMIAGIISCAVIVFFLVYLYFEGAAPLKPIRRRAAWAMVHLPWLLSVILLLEGVKNQLLLSNFISSADYVLTQNINVLSSDSSDAEFEKAFGDILLRAGMTLRDQLQNYNNTLTQNATAAGITVDELDEVTYGQIYGVWFSRLQMSSVLHMYLTFMDNDTIADSVQEEIYQYQNNYTYTYQDNAADYAIILPDIIWELMKPSVQNARYVMALGGLTFICLATLNLIQSWPRDRFQWASIITRYAIGASMTLLLVLNIGKYQEYFTPGDVPVSKRAAVFNWIDAYWVLPTLAIPYGVQFVIDTALVYIAKRYENTDQSVSGRADKSD